MNECAGLQNLTTGKDAFSKKRFFSPVLFLELSLQV
jgi:hypothetical protein